MEEFHEKSLLEEILRKSLKKVLSKFVAITEKMLTEKRLEELQKNRFRILQRIFLKYLERINEWTYTSGISGKFQTIFFEKVTEKFLNF